MIQFMEDIKLKNQDEINIPDAVMIRPKLVAVFDNIKDTINIMTSVYPNKNIKAEIALENANKYINKAIKRLNKDFLIDTLNESYFNKSVNFNQITVKRNILKLLKKQNPIFIKAISFK